MVGVSAVLHFLVDGVCACCLTLLAGGAGLMGLLGVFMTYNVLAFLTQPLTGMLADRVQRRHWLLLASVGLLSVGVLTAAVVAGLWPSSRAGLFAVAVLLGMGNSLFHVWGGKSVAVLTGNDIRALGTFVSTGVLGLAVGILFPSWWLLGVLLVGFAFFSVKCREVSVECRVCYRSSIHSGSKLYILHSTLTTCGSKLSALHSPLLKWLLVVVLMAFVLLRSFAAETFSSSMGGAVLLLAVTAMLGKMAGGWLTKRLGLALSLGLMVAVAVACLLFVPSPWAVFVGLFMVNCTMPVTLYLANVVLPGREGLAFGLLAAALMPGYLLAQFTGDAMGMLPRLLLTLLPTVVIEYGVLVALGEHRADVRWSSVVVNILTNVPLNIFVTFVSDSLTAIVAGELLVVAVEALWYYYFVGSARRALVYSFLCNAISLVVGLLLQLLTTLIVIV